MAEKRAKEAETVASPQEGEEHSARTDVVYVYNDHQMQFQSLKHGNWN